MEEASLSGALRIILYILAFYYIFKFLARLFFPMLVKKAVEKAAENFDRQYGQGAYGQQAYQGQGSARNDMGPQPPKSDKPRETKKIGEYVDFEEID